MPRNAYVSPENNFNQLSSANGFISDMIQTPVGVTAPSYGFISDMIQTPVGVTAPSYTGTRASIVSLAQSSALISGDWYQITDFGSHWMNNAPIIIYLQASSASEFFPVSYIKFRWGDYAGIKTGNVGLWRTGMGVSIGQYAAFSGSQWKNLTGAAGTRSGYNLDATNWVEVLDVNDPSYLDWWMEASYDIFSNVIYSVKDLKGNITTGENFYWLPYGQENFYNNTIMGDSNLYTGLINYAGTFINNVVTSAYIDSDFGAPSCSIKGSTFTGYDFSIYPTPTSINIINSTFTSGDLTIDSGCNVLIDACKINSGNLQFYSNSGANVREAIFEKTNATFTTAGHSLRGQYHSCEFQFNTPSNCNNHSIMHNSIMYFNGTGVVNFYGGSFNSCFLTFSNTTFLTFNDCAFDLDNNNLFIGGGGVTYTAEVVNKLGSTIYTDTPLATALSGDVLTFPTSSSLSGTILWTGALTVDRTIRTIIGMPLWPVKFINQTTGGFNIIINNTPYATFLANRIVSDVTQPAILPNNKDYVTIQKSIFGDHEVVGRKVWL